LGRAGQGRRRRVVERMDELNPLGGSGCGIHLSTAPSVFLPLPPPKEKDYSRNY